MKRAGRPFYANSAIPSTLLGAGADRSGGRWSRLEIAPTVGRDRSRMKFAPTAGGMLKKGLPFGVDIFS